MLELYCEDGSKRYYQGTSSDFKTHESSLMNAVYLSSCVATVKNSEGKPEEYLCVGTSRGEIYQMSVTKNNSVLLNGDRTIQYKDGSHAITSMAGDDESETIMAGTHTQHFLHYKLNAKPDKLKLLSSQENHLETLVNSISCVKTDNGNYFAAGLSNGLVKLFNCKSGAHLVDIQAHSRAVNAVVAHPSKPIFVTVSDDTLVNLWHVKATQKDSISDIELVMS